ncbi:MAG: bifunctional precorrin-2 dehydrogenase/sirohydrochlorin ferrochelatase, partial [Clostridiales bacterium]|nr:bifunctional precorrin-2 dehydrogenase/sirohydrochlorin ferrochelatase [Clostridiales bacterium]
MRNKSERLFPMFVDISDWPILVVGAGKIAQRRIETLLQFALSITVVAPECSETVRQWAQEGRICLKTRAYVLEDLDGMHMVCAATSQNAVNEEIGQECRKRGIPVNVCSDQTLCDFHFPGVVLREELTIGINASGKNH